jgi:osmotically-inducible protein OsmY
MSERVIAAIGADPRLDLEDHEIETSLVGNRVILRGWVRSLADRVRAGEDGRNVAGADTIINELLVGPPGQHSDNQLRDAVLDFLMEDRAIDPTQIQVTVSDGVVLLTGRVRSTTLRRYVGALLWWIPGVRGVHNDILSEHPEEESDELLAEAIQEVLEKDPLVDRTEILVLCHRGQVTLAGTVGGYDARSAAESDAWSVEGVSDVVNQIEVAEFPHSAPILGLDG